MELSARVFGLNSWSLLIPQALEGVATVGVLYTTVRRWFGPPAGLIAGAIVALTPVATLMFRFDNPDALLVLLITLAAYATTRAIESGRTRWLVLAGAFVGLGFLAKQLAAFTVLPGLALGYLWAGPPKIGKRIWHCWPRCRDGGRRGLVGGDRHAHPGLRPPLRRRFHRHNFLNLTFNYNGFGRITGNGGGGFGGTIPRDLERILPGSGRGNPGPGGGIGGAFGGATGITRLFQADFGGQIAWLLPAALLALAAMLWLSRRALRTDRTRAAALVWGGWLLVTGLVFSYMSGIIHPYYTIALAPAIGALVGIGSVELWRVRHTWFACAVLAAGLVITAIWAWVLLDRSPGWFPWLRVVIITASVAAAGMILARRALRPAAGWRRTVLAAAPVSLALIAGLGGPLAYSMDTTVTTQTGAVPSAGPRWRGPSAPRGLAPGREFPGARSGFPGGTDGRLPAGAGSGFGGQASVSTALAKLLEAGGIRLPVGRGHGQQRGLDRTGQQRRPGHGDRRFLRIRPGAEPGQVREARLRAPDPLLRERRRGWRVRPVRGPPGESGASRASGSAADPGGGVPAGFAAAGSPGGGSGDASGSPPGSRRTLRARPSAAPPFTTSARPRPPARDPPGRDPPAGDSPARRGCRNRQCRRSRRLRAGSRPAAIAGSPGRIPSHPVFNGWRRARHSFTPRGGRWPSCRRGPRD